MDRPRHRSKSRHEARAPFSEIDSTPNVSDKNFTFFVVSFQCSVNACWTGALGYECLHLSLRPLRVTGFTCGTQCRAIVLNRFARFCDWVLTTEDSRSTMG